MILLAIELSTRQASLAVQRNANLLAEHSWVDAQARSQSLFSILPELLAKAGVQLGDVDVFVAGRGPGAYTGLRVAMTTARMLALPSQKKVFTLSSGEALAWDVAEEHKVDRVAVLGDARRGKVWAGLFERQGSHMFSSGWNLAAVDRVPEILPDGAVAVTADWERLKSQLPQDLKGLIPAAQYPRAARLAELAFRKISEGIESEALEPIYMHPPV